MTREQIELIIELVSLRSSIAARSAIHQAPPKSWIERADEIEQLLRESDK